MKRRILKGLLAFFYKAGCLFPIKKRILFISSSSDKLDRNLLYIYNEIKRQGINVDVVLRLTKPGKSVFSKVKHLFKLCATQHYIATSKIVILDDYYFPLYVSKKREGTTTIQTWHGSGAFKKFGYSLLDKSFGINKKDINYVKIHSNYDYVIVSGKSSVPAYKDAFNETNDNIFITDIGIPRTDIFFNEELKETLPSKIRGKYNIPKDKKIILYAPTFRGNNGGDAHFNDDIDFDLLKNEIGDEYVILLKLHPFIENKYEIKDNLKGFLFDVSGYIDISELMIVSDILITDYSSAMFEYSLLSRPILFFAKDYFEYIDERGFYIDFRRDLPGKVYNDTMNMIDDIKNKNFEIDKVIKLKNRAFDVADGKSSKHFVDRLIKPNLL